MLVTYSESTLTSIFNVKMNLYVLA